MQSNISVSEAQTSLDNTKKTVISTLRTTVNTSQDIVFNSFDKFYGNPNNSTPGLRLGTTKYVSQLNNDRVAIQTSLTDLQNQINSLTTESNLEDVTIEAINLVKKLESMSDLFIQLFNDPTTEGYSDAELNQFSIDFISVKTTLNSTLASLEVAVNSLNDSADQLDRAKLGGTTSDLSLANAQVKQALGSLRAAQANYAKTILRTPVSGVVNTLNAAAGDYVSSNVTIATVANNNALEVTTYVGESDSEGLSVGQAVIIEDGIDGQITEIAPAVDSVTKKIQVKIAFESDEITNGDSVRVTIIGSQPSNGENKLLIPITAVKFTDVEGSIFTVSNGTLVSTPVELGQIRGEFIEITSGINDNAEIVIDARGLTNGQEVEAKTK